MDGSDALQSRRAIEEDDAVRDEGSSEMEVNERALAPVTPARSAFSSHLKSFAYTPPKAVNSGSLSSVSTSAATGRALNSASRTLSIKRTRSAPEDHPNHTMPTSPRRTKRARVSGSDSSPPMSHQPKLLATRSHPTKARLPMNMSPKSLLTDSIIPGLHLLLVGHNPGIKTALTGEAYAHPSNLFWKLLHSSGITPTSPDYPFPPGIRALLPVSAVPNKPLPPSATYVLPQLYKVGNTNLCARATKDVAGLTPQENLEGAVILEEKIAKYRPEVVGVVGKGIWEAIFQIKMGRKMRKSDAFEYGWAKDGMRMGRVEDGRLLIGAIGFDRDDSLAADDRRKGNTVASTAYAPAPGKKGETRTPKPFKMTIKTASPQQSEQEETLSVAEDMTEAGSQRAAKADARVKADLNTTDWPGARVFVLTTTSGLAAGMSPKEKERIWAELGLWIQQRRGGKEEEEGHGTRRRKLVLD